MMLIPDMRGSVSLVEDVRFGRQVTGGPVIERSQNKAYRKSSRKYIKNLSRIFN